MYRKFKEHVHVRFKGTVSIKHIKEKKGIQE
jgi:hypothetical protein